MSRCLKLKALDITHCEQVKPIPHHQSQHRKSPPLNILKISTLSTFIIVISPSHLEFSKKKHLLLEAILKIPDLLQLTDDVLASILDSCPQV